jgi:enamine deaminase RidA (YjgF/YER057c/UK114 family)
VAAGLTRTLRRIEMMRRESTMANAVHNVGVARQIGAYSDAVGVSRNARWLLTAGTPGMALDGSVPASFPEQAELAWGHIVTMLARAEMTVHDLVKVTQYLVRPGDIAAYAPVRLRFLCGARPASMLLIVPALVHPDLLLEVEAVAARA